MSLVKIVRMLASLSPQELEELRQRIIALQALGTSIVPAAGTGAVETDEAFVLGCIGELLMHLGAEASMLMLLQWSKVKAKDGSAFREKVPSLMKFLGRAHATRIGQRALLLFCFELLYLDMQASGHVVSPKMLMHNIHRIPATLDAHFPGYARAGLLDWIIDRRHPTTAAQ